MLCGAGAVWGAAACGGNAATGGSHTGALPAMAPVGPREQTADQQLSHVLSRLSFGARPGDMQRVREMGVDGWIDLQLHPERIDDAAAEQFMHENYTLLEVDAAELQRMVPPPGVLQQELAARTKGREATAADSADYKKALEATRRLVGEVSSARVTRAATSQRQLQEVMVDFWLNHFTVYAAKGPQARYHLAEYETKSIRPHALGKFRDLLGAVAKSPAMLFYLDNWMSADPAGPQDEQMGPAAREFVNRARQQRALGCTVRVADFDTHQETVELRLRQWIRAVMIGRILCRDHHEGLFQRIGTAVYCHLPLIHRFQQRRLRLRGRAVNFVREQE